MGVIFAFEIPYVPFSINLLVMNKLIYAIGIAVATSLAANSKVEKKQPEHNLKPKVETLEKQPVAPKVDSLQVVL